MIAPLIPPVNARDDITDGEPAAPPFLRWTNAVRVAINGLLSGTSTTSGLLLPRLTTTERDAITATAGETIFNTTTSKAQSYDGAVWRDLW